MSQVHERTQGAIGRVPVASAEQLARLNGLPSEAVQIVHGGRIEHGKLPDPNADAFLLAIETTFGIHTHAKRDENADLYEATIRLGVDDDATEIKLLGDASAVIRRGEVRNKVFAETAQVVPVEKIHDVASVEIDGEMVVTANVAQPFKVPSRLRLHKDGRYFINPN